LGREVATSDFPHPLPVKRFFRPLQSNGLRRLKDYPLKGSLLGRWFEVPSPSSVLGKN